MVLGAENTVSLWLNPQATGGTLFTKQTESSPFSAYYKVDLSGLTPRITLHLYDTSSYNTINIQCLQSLTTSDWHNLILGLYLSTDDDSSYVECSIDGDVETPSLMGSGYLQDLLNDFTISIGASHTTTDFNSFYTGFIYSLKIWNFYSPDIPNNLDYQFSPCSGSCSVCPLTGVCFPTCDISTYPTTCESCHDDCLQQGCVRPDPDCNLCADEICSECSDYESICDVCKDNASLSGLECECDTGYEWNSSTYEC